MRKVKVPTLETERLTLRMWKKTDYRDLYAYSQNPNVGPASGWRPHSSPAESLMILKDTFWTHMCWAMEHKEDGKVIGSIGLDEDGFRPRINSKELGYSMSEDYWGLGLMTEAAKRIIAYAFEDLKLDILSIQTSETNARSRRIIQKCGFTSEGFLRHAYKVYDGEIRNIFCYSMLPEEYQALKAAGQFKPDSRF